MRPQPELLFSAEEIARRVAQIGGEVTRSYAGSDELCVVGLMKSCLVFMGDLIRHIEMPLTCHFLRAASLTEEGSGSRSARTDIVYSTEIPYEGRHILLLDDMIDTGITMSFLLDQIRERGPRSLKVCTLLDKPEIRKIDVHPEWAAFTVKDTPDRFIVGYGLDWAEHYRGLPYLGTIPRPAQAGKATGAGN